MVLSDHSCLRALADSPDYDDPFNARHAEQVQRALSVGRILSQICVLRLVLDRMNILHRTNLTNERLCQWLGAFSYTMNQ